MKQNIRLVTSYITWVLSIIVFFAAATASAIEPPQEPSIKPIIPTLLQLDADDDGIDDQLLSQVRSAEAEFEWAANVSAELAALGKLDATVPVEAVFSRQITQSEIDAFLGAGGEISYVYRAVSYGWNGTLRLGDIEMIAAALGDSLVILQEAKPIQLHLDEATRTGRVRSIWGAGFAGVGAGIKGDSNITVAIIDSGVDTHHTDLAGRQAGWIDQTSDAALTPIDHVQHGTHVAAIAVGTGNALGSSTATLSWTDSDDLTGVPAGEFYPSPVHMMGATTLTSTATFNGAGATSLSGAKALDAVNVWSALSLGTSGASVLGPETNSFTGVAGVRYSQALLAAGNVTHYAVSNRLTNYPAVGDGFNTLSGVCPECQWYGEKVVTNTGSSSTTNIGQALDHIVANRVASNIKVANMSLGAIGNPGLNTTIRSKANTAVTNGIFISVSAGNDGAGITGAYVTDDPARASLVMTVGSSNDINQLTDYTSSGFTWPGADEDYKPDVLAPGGSSAQYSSILAADSNSSDGNTSAAGIADLQANDYHNIQGTSMAAPFVAGAAGLVIDAMQQAGTAWNFTSSVHPLFVKMILNATATETNIIRETAGFDPQLNRNAAGTGNSTGWPARKDRFEGYGIINPDAAVEAVLLSSALVFESDIFPGTVSGRRAWARSVSLTGGLAIDCDLELGNALDADMYLFSGTSDAKGNPVALATSTAAGVGDGLSGAVDENISFTPGSSETGYMVIKRVSGNGIFELSCIAPEAKSISLEITATPANYMSLGDQIQYTYVITNDGNVALDPGLASVTDDKITTVTCPPAKSVPPQGAVTCGATYTIIQDDLDAGSITNKATADVDAVVSSEQTVTVRRLSEYCYKKAWTIPDGKVFSGDGATKISSSVSIDTEESATPLGVMVEPPHQLILSAPTVEFNPLFDVQRDGVLGSALLQVIIEQVKCP